MNIKKQEIRLLSDVYHQLGCSKADVSRWEHNPCSTQALCSRMKRRVVQNAARLFSLSPGDCELFINKAGLSFSEGENRLAGILEAYPGKYRELLRIASISERMMEYYMAGRRPTKEALLAISIALSLPPHKIEHLLGCYGYCLSKSLLNDCVVLWHLNRFSQLKGAPLLLDSINEVLAALELPLLMTKLINR